MNNTYESIKSYQSFPMQMMCVCKSVNDTVGCFEVKTSIDDFCRQSGEVPLFFFVELLGQAAEMFLKIKEGDTKRYLVEVDDFFVASDIQTYLDRPLEIKVEMLLKLAKLNKCKVTMRYEGQMCCEGTYIHSCV
ncbi:MAG: hypothetical protein J5717_06380 [Lachnospiraceae bacterium]|nr:hypothetical protein [Lachnospiraceae bacterium]MCR4678448.1 hypothetical protein [Lachnospiraceae bacterium]